MGARQRVAARQEPRNLFAAEMGESNIFPLTLKNGFSWFLGLFLTSFSEQHLMERRLERKLEKVY